MTKKRRRPPSDSSAEDYDERASVATTIAILSDTHGVLDDGLLALLRAQRPAAIIHGGDIGPGKNKGKGRLVATELVARLEAVAPVHAIAGNVDEDGGGKAGLGPDVVEFEAAGGLRVWLSHGHRFPIKPTRFNDDKDEDAVLAFPAAQAEAKARIAAARPRPDMVVCGHTHQPIVGRLEGKVGDGGPILFINPGSAGPQRFSLPRVFVLLSVVGTGTGSKKGRSSRPVRVNRYEFEKASGEWRLVETRDFVI